MLYSIKNNNQHICCIRNDHRYAVHFRSVIQARKVQYNLNPTALVVLINNGKHDTVIIPKYTKNVLDPVYDMGFYVHTDTIHNVANSIFNNNVGVVIANELLQESKDWFTYQVHVIAPQLNLSTISHLESLL